MLALKCSSFPRSHVVVRGLATAVAVDPRPSGESKRYKGIRPKRCKTPPQQEASAPEMTSGALTNIRENEGGDVDRGPIYRGVLFDATQQQDGSDKPYRRFSRKERYIFRAKHAEQFKTYMFNWGLHRVIPVVKANPTQVSIPQGYFNAPHRFVRWEGLNEAWEVFWYQNNKLNAKPFPVRLYGLLDSKRRAMDYLEDLHKLFGREAFRRPSRESCHKNIHYDEALQAWGTTFWRNGKHVSRYFSAGLHGFNGARELATDMTMRLRRKEAREQKVIRELFTRPLASMDSTELASWQLT